MGRIKNIIFLTSQNLNEWNFQRYGIELLEKNGFKVEYWDATPVLNPVLFKHCKPKDYIDFKGMKFFYNEDELYNQLLNLKHDSIIFDAVTFQFKFIRLYRVISKSKADYIVAILNALPDVRDVDKFNKHKHISVYLRKLRSLLQYTPNAFWQKKILPMIPLKLFDIKPARFFAAGGEGATGKHRLPVDKSTRIIWGHNLDYDIYLKELNNESCERNIAVFLDTCPAMDWKYLFEGVSNNYDIAKYHGLLNNFFDIIEKELKLKVVIAAHPRSDYDTLPDYYKGRKLIKGQTARLVKESKLVLTQMSTSVSFANLFLKPIIFLTYSGMEHRKFIEVLAQMHGKRAIFLDRKLEIDWERELSVSKPDYLHYRQQFIKTDWSENLPVWQILANHLKQI